MRNELITEHIYLKFYIIKTKFLKYYWKNSSSHTKELSLGWQITSTLSLTSGGTLWNKIFKVPNELNIKPTLYS